MGDTLVLRSTGSVWGSTVVPLDVAGRPLSASRRPSTARPAAPEGMPGPLNSGAVPTRPCADPRDRITLTRRGRLLLVGLPVALGIACLIFLGAFLTSAAQAGEGPAQTSPTISVTVGAGETLWGLASHYVPDRDTRDVVAEMIELNDLGSSVVQAGQDISIPTRS
jgi:hypothetical protein